MVWHGTSPYHAVPGRTKIGRAGERVRAFENPLCCGHHFYFGGGGRKTYPEGEREDLPSNVGNWWGGLERADRDNGGGGVLLGEPSYGQAGGGWWWVSRPTIFSIQDHAGPQPVRFNMP